MFFRFIRIFLLFEMLILLAWCGTLIVDRLDPVILLNENPLRRAGDLIDQERPDEALLLASFARYYLPVQQDYSVADIEDRANSLVASPDYYIRRFSEGALTGEVADTPTLLGAISLDMFVIGDIRDLVVQGYREFDTGDGDEVLIGLSAAGLLLTLAPEASWAPALVKSLWRGQRFSRPLQDEIRKSFSAARQTGDYRKIRRLFSDIMDLTNTLGTGPAMTLMKQVRTGEELGKLARVAKQAPSETYTLVSINGIDALRGISRKTSGPGKLKRSVKIAARETKVFNKIMQAVPLSWLIVGYCLLLAFTGFLFAAGRQRKFILNVPGEHPVAGAGAV